MPKDFSTTGYGVPALGKHLRKNGPLSLRLILLLITVAPLLDMSLQHLHHLRPRQTNLSTDVAILGDVTSPAESPRRLGRARAQHQQGQHRRLS